MSAPQWIEAKKQKNDRKGGSSERFLKSSNIAMHGLVAIRRMLQGSQNSEQDESDLSLLNVHCNPSNGNLTLGLGTGQVPGIF
ncbi:LOW QUALITY PROTEIN: hypothetical protein YC2023_087229 [Brassica napus]